MAEVSNPKVVVKKKQVPVIVEFCLDESIEFSVKQQTFPDIDWEIEMKVKDFKAAVLLGMYLRENRIDPDGIDQQRYKRSNGKKADEKPEPVSKEVSQPKEDKIKEEKTEVLPSNEPTLI